MLKKFLVGAEVGALKLRGYGRCHIILKIGKSFQIVGSTLGGAERPWLWGVNPINIQDHFSSQGLSRIERRSGGQLLP